jgi:cytochrome c oxidase assembly protein Cox11
LEVSLSRSEVIVQPGDVFEVFLTIKNRSSRPIITRIGHLVEPQAIADYLDFVECGFLLPVTLQPGEQEYSGRYMLRGSIPEGVRQLNVTYDFRPLR